MITHICAELKRARAHEREEEEAAPDGAGHGTEQRPSACRTAQSGSGPLQNGKT